MGKIEAVLFDADGVLQSPSKGGCERLAALGGSTDRSLEFLLEFYDTETPSLRGEVDFAIAVAELLQKWASPFTVEQVIEAHKNIIEVNDESLDVVRALRRSGVGSYLATNQHEYRAQYMSEILGYANIFDSEFYSCRIGHMKPSPEYFHTVLKALPIPPERLLFIDDKELNVNAARSVGIRGVQYEMGYGVEALCGILRKYGLEACLKDVP